MCPRCDPLLRAGYWVCDLCRECSYPVAAGWLNDWLIIASFEPGCDHVKAFIEVTDPSQMICESRCVATTTRGTRCRNNTRDGTDFCRVHAPRRVS